MSRSEMASRERVLLELSELLREPDLHRPLDSLETLVVLAALQSRGIEMSHDDFGCHPRTIDEWAYRLTASAAEAVPQGNSNARDLLIYVQVPFCPSKCHFCGWVSNIPVNDLRLREGDSPRAAYLAAVRQQIRYWGPRLADRGYRPKVMYWGGGTASILSTTEFRLIVDTLREEFDLSGVEEATVESSPDTLTSEKLAAYRTEGFNRVSIGVQSFDDRRLASEGRAHRSGQARTAIHMVRDAGIDDLNVDLMCGLPDETPEEFHGSASALLELPVSHISLYPYAPVEGTVMFRQLQRGQSVLDRRERVTAYLLGERMFEAAGYPEYAISYFGRKRCQADMAYYQLEMDYIGFGSGADSLIEQRAMRTHSALARYTARPTELAVNEPAAAMAARFLIYQSMTMFEGVDAKRWQERIGVPIHEVLGNGPVAAWVAYLQRHAGLVRDERGIRLPRKSIVPVYLDFLWSQLPHRSTTTARTKAGKSAAESP